jgi:DNA-binding transcriptional LysR family regulator
MDLRQLRYFLAVAEEAHFGRAANRLHIVQPALSMQIRALEEALGVALFRRTSRRVELTEAGALFRVEAERTIEQAEHARLVVQRAGRGELGSLRIGFSSGIATLTGLLSRHIRWFHARYPEVEVDLREVSVPAQTDDILAGRLDLGYCPAYGGTFDPRLAVEFVGSWPYLVAIGRDHPLADQKTIPVKALVNEPVVYLSGTHGHVDLVRRVLGRMPETSYRATTVLTALTMVAGGLGFALAAQPLSEMRIPGVVYRPLAGFGPRYTLALLSRSDESSGVVNAFLKLVRPRSAPRGAGH